MIIWKAKLPSATKMLAAEKMMPLFRSWFVRGGSWVFVSAGMIQAKLMRNRTDATPAAFGQVRKTSPH
jgi:hypothetical protein